MKEGDIFKTSIRQSGGLSHILFLSPLTPLVPQPQKTHTDTHLNYWAISVALPVSNTALKPAGIN